jgi:uncharacterized protein (TIGR01777 family)
MHIAITGSRGLVGSALISLLTTRGHQLTRIVRGAGTEHDVTWDPAGDSFDASRLAGVDGVVHLAGESVAGGRWTEDRKLRIRNSRVQGTRVLCDGLARMPAPPRVLVSASAVGIYGDRGDDLLTEQDSAGQGFLAGVARDWEAATSGAIDAGIRVITMRFGVVLSRRGGALAKMLPPFRLGGGGKIGSGRQYCSWITLDDAVGAIQHALMTDSLSGPVNAVAPNPVTNAQFARALGRVLSRPALVSMPAFAARLAFGEMANELLLASTRVQPQRLLESGYNFHHPTLEGALRYLLMAE